MTDTSEKLLFGGSEGWSASDWTASDDRVRGGKSQSYIQLSDGCATFCGNLDIKTLGGAGFASQRTTGDDRQWDLATSDGLALTVDAEKSDGKKYTFIIKDELLPKDPDSGREQSTVSWEYDFYVPNATQASTKPHIQTITIPWDEFQPTYRGKACEPEHSLRKDRIKRISIMMRSFFGTQHGQFSLNICKIAAFKLPEKQLTRSASRGSDQSSDSFTEAKECIRDQESHEKSSLWSRLFDCCHL